MSTRPLIRGAGFVTPAQLGSSHVPPKQAATLRSRAYANVLDLLGEGEIEGLVDGLKSIYLDQTPIQAADGSYNFTGVTVDIRNGTQGQGYLPGFAAIESDTVVNVEVTAATAITRQITDANINAVRVRIGIPQLTSLNRSTGDIEGTAVELAIDVRSAGGSYVEKIHDTINGKTTSRYERAYRIELPGTAPWDIRVRRITVDSTQDNLSNQTFWSGYTQIVDSKLRAPNSALVGLRIDSSQFNSIPARAYRIKGLRVRIPSNYNPTTRAYTGVWDGTFQIAWTDNPAWCWYDLVTNDRYGLGAYITASQVDKWALYTIAKYCDGLVPDGFGGQEPRFRCNLYLQSREEALRVIGDMSSIFRGMSYFGAGTITATQDAPADPAYLYNNTNVVDGIFNYSGTARRSRHTVALVAWNDPAEFHKQKLEYVPDLDGIARYGVHETQIVAFGCSSRGQAHRQGRWLLQSERLAGETVTFKVGLDGSIARPGQLIKVADQPRAGARMSGRVSSATVGSVTIDQDIVVGSGWTISIIKPDGTIESRAVSSQVGRVINVASGWSTAPNAQSLWMLESPTLVAQQFRVLTVAESEDGIHEIMALAHNPDKYTAIEQDITLEPLATSALSTSPDAAINLQVTEGLYQSGSQVRSFATFSWQNVAGATTYEVSYSRAEQNPVLLPATGASSIDIRDTSPGVYTFNVTAINGLGRRGRQSSLTATIYGKTVPPANVQGLGLTAQGSIAMLRWVQATDLDVVIGGRVRIRHSSMLTGALWENASDLVPAVAGSATSVEVPLVNGTYMAKFVDSSGYESATFAACVTDAADLSALNVVDTITENPAFTGAKTNVAYDADQQGIKLDGVAQWDAYPGNVDSWSRVDELGGIQMFGTYLFSRGVDLVEVYPCRLTASVEAYSYDNSDEIDSRSASVDDWTNFENLVVSSALAKLYVRYATNTGTPVFGDWVEFAAGDFNARAFEFKVELSAQDSSDQIIVKGLSVTVDMPDRVDQQANLVSGAASYHVTFSPAFRAAPAVAITAQDLATGDYWSITNKTASGFDVAFRSSAAALISRSFDVLAKGYGRALPYR